MARVTVEDCLERVPNRFALVHLAARRARDLIKGDTPTVEHAKNKETVLALRGWAEEGGRQLTDEPYSLLMTSIAPALRDTVASDDLLETYGWGGWGAAGFHDAMNAMVEEDAEAVLPKASVVGMKKCSRNECRVVVPAAVNKCAIKREEELVLHRPEPPKREVLQRRKALEISKIDEEATPPQKRARP